MQLLYAILVGVYKHLFRVALKTQKQPFIRVFKNGAIKICEGQPLKNLR